MKKLKTWQIVLLVIFYPVGICVLIYRLWKKHELKKEREVDVASRASEKARREAELNARLDAIRAEAEEESRLYSDMPFKVVGVTFKNEGNRSRQAILRKIKFGDAPYDKGTVEISLSQYEYEGETAIGVYADGAQVGNISKADVSYILPLWDNIVCVKSFEVTGGGKTPDGEPMSYGMKIALRFKREQ